MGAEESKVTDSILISVREALDADEYYDKQLVMHINSVFSALAQLGVGPESGFVVTDENDVWDDYTAGLEDPKQVINMLKSYLVLKVKLLFDTPTGSVLGAYQEQAKEYEWRLQEEYDRG